MTRRPFVVLAIVSVGAGAQLRGQGLYAGAGLTIATLRVWRGLTRVSHLSLMPELNGAAVFPLGPLGLFGLSAGVWSSYNPERGDSGALSDLDPGQFGFGEVQYWAELTHPLGPLTLGGGLVVYEYRGKISPLTRTPAWNTTELYGHVELALWALAPSLTAYRDVRRVHGWYIEPAMAASPVRWTFGKSRNPLGKWRMSVDVGGAAGFSFGQEVDAARPSDSANFANRGLTHVLLSAGVTVSPPIEIPIELQLSFQGQLNQDAFVRRTAVGHEANTKRWFTIAAHVGGPVIRGQGVP